MSALPSAPLVPALAGLVYAFRFRPGQPPQQLRDEEVLPALQTQDGWLWLHFQLNDTRARDWIAHCAALPEVARALFADHDDHPRLESEDGALFGILTDFQMELDGVAEDFGRLRFACTPQIIVSARRQALRSVEQTRLSLGRGAPAEAPVAIIDRFIDCFCDGANAMLQTFAQALDHVEDHIVSDRVEDERKDLARVRRKGVALKRQLASTLALLRPLASRPEEDDEGPQIESEPLVQRLEELSRELSAVQERARLLQDEISAKLAEETNRSLNRISLMTAAMLPGTLITGLFGMNTGSVPFAQTEGGFWWAFMICVLATLTFFVFLRRTGAGSK